MTQKSIYEITPQEGLIDDTLEELRSKISQIAGVTLQGNRLTVRWNSTEDKTKFRMVHMVILEVEDGEPNEEEDEK